MPFREVINGVTNGPTEDDIRWVIVEMNARGEPDMENWHGWCFCHTTAGYIAEALDGAVYGYLVKDNPDAELPLKGSYDGHDFAIVGHYLVDWWAKDMAGLSDRDIFDLSDPTDAAEAMRLYGSPDRWSRSKTNPIWDSRNGPPGKWNGKPSPGGWTGHNY
ncbi:MAG: hypothetical protein ACE5FA_07720 [Dehalococcoidia bacterium]